MSLGLLSLRAGALPIRLSCRPRQRNARRGADEQQVELALQPQWAVAQRVQEKQFNDARIVAARFRKAGTTSVFIKNNEPQGKSDVRLENLEDPQYPI
jgi:hypothetical protein